MRIRKARLTDAKALAKLVYSLAHYYLQCDTDQLPDWFLKPLTEKSFNARLMSDNYTTLLCEDEGKIVGYVAIRGGSHLHHLFVDEAYQRKGLGRQLWDTVRGLCPSPEYMLRSSMQAIPVYEKFGFEISGDVSEKEGIQFQPMRMEVEEKPEESEEAEKV
jgi:ribosomal protein S18 acetylase RimI-like enzyme